MIEKVKDEVINILEEMIEGKKDIIKGCSELSGYLMEGYDFIYWDFDEYNHQLQKFPITEQYHLWEESALEQKLKELESRYKQKVIDLAKELLAELN
ncbi:hypothetical protein WAK64_21980 [Bacillus spongiae]|uniref:Uncharacterized protein n=1 Tax=Bacillus spongiae TaxID=2683610 RepID=A0ABU8HKZ6_9BACI